MATSPQPSLSSLPSPTSPTSSTSSAQAARRKRVSAEHTLTRVRENQRRHRARRKDHITTLEEKLAETEKQLEEARAEIALLRRERDVGVVVLPCPHGEDAEERRDEGGEAVVLRKDSAVEDEDVRLDGGMEGVESLHTRDGRTSAHASTTAQRLALYVPTIQPDTFLDTFYAFSSLPSPIPNTTSLDIAGPPPCCEDTPASVVPPSADPECSTCKTRPAPLPSESTTLCAQAYVMISQQNFRDVDAGTIRLWLYQGYRRAQRQGEGCRVENGALFRLLDFISGI